MMEAWLNGTLVAEQKATISIFDRGYLYGEGLFETLRCYNGKPAFVDRHHRRLSQNCRTLGVPLPCSEPELEKAIRQLLQANHLQEAVVRLTVSTAGASFGVGRPKDAKPTWSIFARAAEMDQRLFETGVAVYPHPDLINDNPLNASIKSTSYLTKMLARQAADQQKAFDTLLKNRNGFWVEGSRTNLFIVLDHQVVTAPLSDGLLNGITREVVLELLKEKKIPHREDHITDVMLQNAEEVFLTGSTSEVMPVCELKGMGTKKIAKNSINATLLAEYRKNLPPEF